MGKHNDLFQIKSDHNVIHCWLSYISSASTEACAFFPVSFVQTLSRLYIPLLWIMQPGSLESKIYQAMIAIDRWLPSEWRVHSMLFITEWETEMCNVYLIQKQLYICSSIKPLVLFLSQCGSLYSLLKCLWGDFRIRRGYPGKDSASVPLWKALMPTCGVLTLAGSQVPTEATLSLPSSTGQGRESLAKGSWVEMRTGRDHSPTTVMGKTDSTWGN